MVDSTAPNGEIHNLLKPFYQRASDAEDRLSRLEASLSKKQDPDAQKSEIPGELRVKLEQLAAELASEREKVAKLIHENAQLEAKNAKLAAKNAKLAAENAKQNYRIIHLTQAVKEPDP